METKAWKLIWLVLFLTALSACSAVPQPPQIEHVVPPGSLIIACDIPRMVGNTNDDLVHHTMDLKESLQKCNRDKASLRKWRSQYAEIP